MIEINEINFPKLYTLLTMIENDNGGCATGGFLVDKSAEELADYETAVSDLTQEQLYDLATGEELCALELVEEYGLEEVHIFLNEFFNGELGGE